MMGDQGKCIFVNGPTFAGKTTFILKLIVDIPELSVVNYELFFSRNKKYDECNRDFYSHIFRKVSNGEKVICESVQNNVLTETLCDVTFDIPLLNIVVMPTLENHCKYQSEYRRKFGYARFELRDGGINAKDLRSVFYNTYKSDAIVYDGTNYVEILEAVKKYVMDN